VPVIIAMTYLKIRLGPFVVIPAKAGIQSFPVISGACTDTIIYEYCGLSIRR